MKNRFLLIALLILSGIISHQTMAQDRSYYTLGISSKAPTNIKFINNSDLEVKVLIFNKNDGVMTIPIATFNVQAGGTGTYKTGTYNVKMFKPQLFDKLLNTKTNVSGDLQMKGTENNFSSVRVFVKQNTVFKNATGEKIKICIYHRDDNIKTIPLACYELKDNTSTATYNGDLESYFVSVFRPELIDRLLLTQICPEQSDITVQKK